jgi:hypothetical protein
MNECICARPLALLFPIPMSRYKKVKCEIGAKCGRRFRDGGETLPVFFSSAI